MPNDPAAFRNANIQVVYGQRPVCFLTLHWQWVDKSHILGRGYDHGASIKGGKLDRAMFSSIFNFAPLHRDVHKGPMRDTPLMRTLLLQTARKHVMNAVGLGTYELNDNDKEFLAFADEWMRENLPSLSSE